MQRAEQKCCPFYSLLIHYHLSSRRIVRVGNAEPDFFYNVKCTLCVHVVISLDCFRVFLVWLVCRTANTVGLLDD